MVCIFCRGPRRCGPCPKHSPFTREEFGVYTLALGKINGKKLGHDWAVRDLRYKRKRKPKGGRK